MWRAAPVKAAKISRGELPQYRSKASLNGGGRPLAIACAIRLACSSVGEEFGWVRLIEAPPRIIDDDSRELVSFLSEPAISTHKISVLGVASSISPRYESLAIRISMGYVLLMIRSFKGKFAEPILQGRMVPKGFPANLAKVARRKLIMVDSAAFLEALNSPPGNRLEALKGDLAGRHSIRVNDQWRIVFRWTDAGPEDVEIIDYH
jgi:proteic killer suppression protein